MLSVVSNTTLVIFKVIVGVLIGSVSVISEAIHSGVDLVAAVIAYIAVRKSAKPPDEEHPFGHGKVENLSGTIEAVLIFVAAGWIIYEAVKKLIYPHPLEAPSFGVLVMLLSTVVNYIVSHWLFKIGNETDSVALKADAWHLRTDVYTSFGVMVGLGVIFLGNRLFPDINLTWIDPVAALCVAILIIKAAYDLTMQSALDLLDVKLPEEEEELFRNHIAEFRPAVKGFHKMRTRKAGSHRFVDFHLLVDPEMSVARAHRIMHDIMAAFREHYPETVVTIHVEPYDGTQITADSGPLKAVEAEHPKN
ncbi:MAG: cation diffusion facilitator family transporter [Candidatus Brocadiia bacterium]